MVLDLPRFPSPPRSRFFSPQKAPPNPWQANIQSVATVLAQRPQPSAPHPQLPGLSELGQLIFVSWLID